MKDVFPSITEKVVCFLNQHHVGGSHISPLMGKFSLYREHTSPDLYGMIDAVYTLYTVGLLTERTNCSSREAWAEQILDCQDEKGWFSRHNLRGHPREHATAYAIGALRLLEIEPDEQYVAKIEPIEALEPILIDRDTFLRWITWLDFRPTPWDILDKKLGWHYIWRGSHVGGGVPAIVGMTRDLIEQWWPGQVDLDQWFTWYFEWLDAQANPKTGYWQRAFWNLVYRKPTLIDIGGAVHFFWIYEALDRPFPYPEAVIESTLKLQKDSGLYKDRPFCIDLDGNFCLIRSYLQLSEERKSVYRDRVYDSAERNFEAIVKALTEKPLEDIYDDSHGLPGALAALIECVKLPKFKYADAIRDWQHPLDKAWWL
jgi:hypothetical protein